MNNLVEQALNQATDPDGQMTLMSSRPPVVCLCGSTKFWREFTRQNLRLTMRGIIVLSIGAASGTDDDHFGNLPPAEYESVKRRLDRLHMHKVEMADEILVLNCGGYIGQSTAREILHAMSIGKPVRFLEPVDASLLMSGVAAAPSSSPS